MKALNKKELKNVKGGRVTCRRTGRTRWDDPLTTINPRTYYEYRCRDSSHPEWADWIDWYSE